MLHENTELTIYLIRHAQSEMNLKPELIRGKNEFAPLTKLGRLQARRLGKSFAKEGINFDQVYTSPALRNLQTSSLVLKELYYPIEKVIKVPALEELNQGDWEGEERSRVLNPKVLHRINSLKMLFTPPNGESQKMTQRRVANWFAEEILYNGKYLNKPTALAVFSHGITLKCLLQDIMHFDESFIYKMYLGNTGYIKLFLSKDGLFIPRIVTHP